MAVVKFQTPYDITYVDPGVDFTGDPGVTKQSFRDECDINVIMKRYEKDGLVTHVSKYEGQYGDFGDYEDYHASLNHVKDVESMFMTLTASIRDRFENDAGKFLDFVQNPANAMEMAQMGLADYPATPPDLPVEGASTASQSQGGDPSTPA